MNAWVGSVKQFGVKNESNESDHTSDLGSFSIAGLQGYQINYSLH